MPEHRPMSDRQLNRPVPLAPFLPDMCTLQAVFLLVMLGELLAFGLVLADSGLLPFDWESLGLRSFLIQWIVLLSAALLCPLRFRLSAIPAWLAGLLSYLLVLGVTLVCSLVGLWGLDGWQAGDQWTVLSNVLQAGIFAGVVLRYLYMQQQWSNQQKAELRARIQALQSRIQPHFLFNSMNSIASLIAIEPAKAERLVEDLSSLFRANLAEPGLVSLANELELCRQYLDIEQTRLGPRLEVRWQVSAAVEEVQQQCQIPRLLLQPLLENAIQHGISPSAQGGTIDIQLVKQESTLGAARLQVTIANPVPTPEPAAAAAERRGNQLALDNIRHRLQAHFGPQAHLRADWSADRTQFVVNLSYPLETQAAKDPAWTF